MQTQAIDCGKGFVPTRGSGIALTSYSNRAAWARAAFLVFASEAYQQATVGAPTSPLFGLVPRDNSCLTCRFRQKVTRG
jgi:hypothetical protein